MDYEGQRLSELIFYWIILSLGAVGWVIGYFQQDFYIVFQFWLVGVVLSVIVSSTMGGNVFLHQEVCGCMTEFHISLTQCTSDESIE